MPGGCSRHDAPVTPIERQRKVKPKGKAVFNLNFQLFSESRWEDGDMFCSLDPHKNPEAAEVPNARAEKSIIHVEWGEGRNIAQTLIIPLQEHRQADFDEWSHWGRREISSQKC